MAKYGSFAVFQRITADALNAPLPDFYLKQSSTTRASNVTLADDPELIIPLAANGSYLVEFVIRYATTTAAAFKSAWTVPASTTSSNRLVHGLGGNATGAALNDTPSATTFSTNEGVHGYTTAVIYGSRNSVSLQVQLIESSIVTIGAAGNVTFQWAQVTSTAVNTVVAAGSYGRATQIA